MASLVKIISSEINSAKERIVKFLRLGDTDIQTSDEVGPYGIDSSPIEGMIAVYSKTTINGETVIVGYINKNQLADVGELRLYSTDKNGTQQFYTWLKNDGTYEIGGNAKHMARFEELKAGHDQLKNDLNAFIDVFNAHIHPTPSGPSSATATAGTHSNASIDSAKIDEIKTL
jgi:hypothetical protein